MVSIRVPAFNQIRQRWRDLKHICSVPNQKSAQGKWLMIVLTNLLYRYSDQGRFTINKMDLPSAMAQASDN